MPVINPFVVLVDDDTDEPIKADYIEDAAKRSAVRVMQQEWAAAPAADKPSLEIQLAIAVDDAKPSLTVGRAIIDAVKATALKGDEEMSGDQKCELDELAQRIRAVVRHGKVGELVSFKATEVTLLKARINKMYRQASIVAQLFRAFRDDPPPRN